MSDIKARSLNEAEKIAKNRSIGETVLGRSDKKSFQIVPFNESTSVIHLLSFAGWIALKSGVISPDELLSDRGILHEYVHYLEGHKANKTPKRSLVKKINKMLESVSLCIRCA